MTLEFEKNPPEGGGGGGSGNVTGPGSATDNAAARFNGTDGKVIQNSVIIIGDDDGTNALISNVKDPVADQDAATKKYVDDNIGGGGDVTGPGSSTDNAIARWDGAGGDTLQNSVIVVGDGDPTNALISNVKDPVADQDAASKKYVDDNTTAVVIKTRYESNADTNAFTDADETNLDANTAKLAGIEANATADQTDAEIRAAVEAATDSNVFTDLDHSKLNDIEPFADVTDATNVDAAGAVMESDLIDSSSGIPDGGKPIKLDAGGEVDLTMLPTFAGIDSVTPTGLVPDDASPENNRFLRDDGTWAFPTVGVGLVSGPGSSTDDAVMLWDGTGGDTAKDSSLSGADLSKLTRIMDGAIVETIDIDVIEDTGAIKLQLEQNGGGDLTCRFAGASYTLDCTPAAEVTLTAGTDVAPQHNYVYITESGGTLTLTNSTASFPSTAHCPVATVVCQSAASLATDGAFKVHAWTDHYNSSSENGHIAHLNKKFRNLEATWEDGVAPGDLVVSSPDAYISVGSGNVFQLHTHAFPALDMNTPSSDPVYLVNDPTTAYKRITTFDDITQDASGNTINNKYMNLVVWGVVSEKSADCHLFINLPTNVYTVEADAVADVDNYAVYSWGTEYRGCAFLIARYTVQAKDSGAWSQSAKADLRGLFPSTSPGGGATADHSALSNLDADDHSQYSLADGTRAFTGEVAGVTPTVDASLATKGFVEGLVDDLLGDLDSDTPADADIIKFSIGGWTLIKHNLNTLEDVNVLLPSDGTLLRYNGSIFVAYSETNYASVDGTRPSWVAQASAPGSPSDGDAWYRTTAPQKLFVYNGTDSRWYATESILLDFNRNSTAVNGDWLGRHRLNALSSADRGVRMPFTTQWYSMEIGSTVTPSATTMSVDLRIGASDVHTITWDGVNNQIQEDINEVSSATDGVRAQVNVGAGTAPANTSCILLGREYV